MKFLVLIGLMIGSWIVHAQEIFPTGCVPSVVSGALLSLSTKKPLIIMIHNLSNNDIWVTHPETNPSASAGWSSRLQAGKWSALALDSSKAFALSCIESQPGHEQQIPCAGVLAVCKWPNATMPEHTSGTFWAGEDMALSPLTAYIERRGFVLSPPIEPKE